MGYTPENNPYIPGDPYSYDLAWMVEEVKKAQAIEVNAQQYANNALQSQIEAQQAKDLAMGWAIGEDDGGPIPPGEPQYENNSKYYAEQAADSAGDAAESADDAAISESNARYYADHIGDPVSGIVTDWMDANITQPTTPVVDASLLVSGAAADSEVTGDKIREIYNADTTPDIFGANASVAGYVGSSTSGTWDSSTKKLSVYNTEQKATQQTCYVALTPKMQAGHDYKIAFKWNLTRPDGLLYIYNIYSLYNFNNRDTVEMAVSHLSGYEHVYDLSATQDGWLTFGKVVTPNFDDSWEYKIAVYDVTGLDVTDVPDSIWLDFPDNAVISETGILIGISDKTDYNYDLVSNFRGQIWSALGDSLTAIGSGSQYLGYTKNRLGLSEYYNNGIGGTPISGAQSANAMYQDSRINAIDNDSECVTIMGGTNDFWQQYYKDHPNANMTGWGECTRDNNDPSTFCGAYNLLISKMLYKFCHVSGYYQDVDYTGITQTPAADPDFRIILIAPPQHFWRSSMSIGLDTFNAGVTAAYEYTKAVAELWALPCVDSWEMGMNDMNKSLFFTDPNTDATHFNDRGHERLASLLIDKAIQISRYK